jgi:hypothetical protein
MFRVAPLNTEQVWDRRNCGLDRLILLSGYFVSLGTLKHVAAFFLANPLIQSLSTILFCVYFFCDVLCLDPDRGHSVLAGVMRFP